MLNQLANLPFVEYWLPALFVGMGLVLAFFVWRGSPRKLQPAVAGGSGVDADGAAGLSTFKVMAEPAKEQRRSFRRGGNPVTVHYAPPTRKEQPNEGWVVDRSMGGFCLMTLEEVPLGSVLAVVPTNVTEMVPWVEVEVTSCRKGEDCYEVGCRFIKPPPYSIMLLFG